MNLWTLLSLIPGVIHFSLGLYVLLREPKRKVNLAFFLYALSLSIWCISEFFHRSANSFNIVFLWTRIGGLGWCFMPSFWAYFILIFTRQDKLLKNKLTYIGLFLLPVVTLYLFITTDLIYSREPRKVFFGYTVLPGKLIWIYTFYYILIYVLGISILIKFLNRGTTLEKKQSKPILTGSTIFLLLGTVTNVIYPSKNVPATEFATTYSIAWAISIFYSVIKHRLFIVFPSEENSIETPKRYSLEKGFIYLIKEEKPDKGYEIFYDQITHAYSGLCISKLSPERIKQTYNISKTPILWLTFNNNNNTISPKDTDGLISVVLDFVRRAEKPFVFFDCFDQIKFANGFEKSLYLLKDLISICKDSNATMLISIPDDMFERQQLSILSANLKEVV